jgi:hypothetical protein
MQNTHHIEHRYPSRIPQRNTHGAQELACEGFEAQVLAVAVPTRHQVNVPQTPKQRPFRAFLANLNMSIHQLIGPEG